MKAGDEAVTKLGDFLTAISEDDWRTAENAEKQLLSWKIVLMILKTIFVIIFPNHFFMSVSREDLLGLL